MEKQHLCLDTDCVRIVIRFGGESGRACWIIYCYLLEHSDLTWDEKSQKKRIVQNKNTNYVTTNWPWMGVMCVKSIIIWRKSPFFIRRLHAVQQFELVMICPLHNSNATGGNRLCFYGSVVGATIPRPLHSHLKVVHSNRLTQILFIVLFTIRLKIKTCIPHTGALLIRLICNLYFIYPYLLKPKC